jgi:cobalt/nickel transport system ATP-binding protein
MPARPVEIRTLSVWREDPLGGDPRRVITDLDLDFDAGERVALVGANGAGKTSLLLALVGAVPFEGRVSYGDLALDRRTLGRVRNEVAFVFAEPADQLFSPSVREEVAFGPKQRGLTGAALDERASAAIELVGLSGFEARAPASLSLGEQRRLALATALSVDPAVLLLDEPTASLDGRARRAVLDALRRTHATLVVATHDLDAALELDARVVLLKGGSVVGSGPARELLSDEAELDRAGLLLPLSLTRRK